MIWEPKSDNTFPNKNFFLDLIKIDIWRGLILYINEQLPRKMLINHENSIASETIILEFHQLKSKWLMIGIYKLPNQKERIFTRVNPLQPGFAYLHPLKTSENL